MQKIEKKTGLEHDLNVYLSWNRKYASEDRSVLPLHHRACLIGFLGCGRKGLDVHDIVSQFLNVNLDHDQIWVFGINCGR